MFSLASRAQALGSQAITASAVTAVAVALISLIQLYVHGAWSIDTTAVLNVRAVALMKNSFVFGAQGKPKENLRITFDLDADLAPLFNWNTKQVFVYLTAEYPGKLANLLNKVTYWDKIVRRGDTRISLRNARSKYSVWDVERFFRGRNATVRLEWNVQPYVGALVYGATEKAATFTFPTRNK